MSSSHKSCCFKLMGFHSPGSINELNTVSQGIISILLGTYSEKLTVHLLTSNGNIGHVIIKRCGNDRITIHVHMCKCVTASFLCTQPALCFPNTTKSIMLQSGGGHSTRKHNSCFFCPSHSLSLTRSHTHTHKILPSATGNRLLIHTAVLNTS